MSSPPSPTDIALAISWMMTCGSIGVTFTPQVPGAFTDPAQLGESLPPWPWVQTIRGRLPNGREVAAVQQGSRMAFQPPLPVGAQIIAEEHGREWVLHTITEPPPLPSGSALPERAPADE